jgi:DNA-binding XRE family transcriptional regulator
MASTVLLFTDRPGFQATWTAACGQAGLSVVVQPPDAVGGSLSLGTLAVLDAAAQGFDEDELLACTGLARALGAAVAVVLPENSEHSATEDMLLELSGGLVTRDVRDAARICSGLSRRADAVREARFEYLSVSPRGGELLAIVGSGHAVLLPRPLGDADDGSDVQVIHLAEDARSAELELVSGKRLKLEANTLPASGAQDAKAAQQAPATLGDVDGVRLGQRLRALRLAAGLTQAELARRTGIHRPNIARVEAGRHTPSLETLARLAAAIGVPTARVLAG